MISSITKKARLGAGNGRNYPQAEHNENHPSNDVDEGEAREVDGVGETAPWLPVLVHGAEELLEALLHAVGVGRALVEGVGVALHRLLLPLVDPGVQVELPYYTDIPYHTIPYHTIH